MRGLLSSSYGAGLVALLGLAACATNHAVPPPPATVWATQPPAPEPYVLQTGDMLTVKFYFNPELNEDVVIRPDGKISLQLIGDMQAAGTIPETLATELMRRYTGELANPKVSVMVRQLGAPPVYVGGEVGRQGVLNMGAGGLTLFQAIQGAGGLLKTAHLKQVILIRKGSGGEPLGYSVDVRPIASGEHPEMDVPLRPYDVVFVPRSKIADVNLFVEQYIRNNLPVTPSFAISPLI